MRPAAFLIIAVAASACAASAAPEPRTAKAQTKLTHELAGKVAGAPVSCLPSYRSQDMVVVDDNTILFRNGRTVYRNDPPGGCSPLGSGNYTLVTKSIGGNGLCRGDIATVVDLTSRFTVGSCSFGDFIPYTPAKG